MRFAMVEYVPHKVPSIDAVVKALIDNSVNEWPIVRKAKELVGTVFSTDFVKWHGYYGDTIRTYFEDNAVYIAGLKITPTETMDSRDRLEAKISIFETPPFEPVSLTKVTPVHAFWLLRENSIAMWIDESNFPMRDVREWAGRLVTSGRVELATTDWNGMVKRFRSREVEGFASKLRQDGMVKVFQIQCRTVEGKLSYIAELWRGDNTVEHIDIEKSSIFPKLREELTDPDNRRMLALECNPDTVGAFVLSFPRLEREMRSWYLSIGASRGDGFLDDRSLVKRLSEVAKLFRRYHFSPPPPYSRRIDSF